MVMATPDNINRAESPFFPARAANRRERIRLFIEERKDPNKELWEYSISGTRKHHVTTKLDEDIVNECIDFFGDEAPREDIKRDIRVVLQNSYQSYSGRQRRLREGPYNTLFKPNLARSPELEQEDKWEPQGNVKTI